jgi:hypothetical protein
MMNKTQKNKDFHFISIIREHFFIGAKLLQKILIYRAGNQSIFGPGMQEHVFIIFQEFNLILLLLSVFLMC